MADPALVPPAKNQGTTRGSRIGFAVFLTLLGIHTLCLGERLGYTEDALPIIRHTEIVVRHHHFTDPISPEGDYSIYGIGMTLWYLPVRLAVGAIIPDSVAPKVTAFYLRLGYISLNVLATAGTAAVLCAWGLGLGYSEKASVLGAFCFSLATLAFPYARYDFSEPVTGFFLVTGVYSLWRHHRQPALPTLFLAGAMLGCGALTRIVVGLAAVPLVGMVAPVLKPGSRIRGLSLLILPLVTALGVIFAYNYGRFHNPFETGYPIDFDTPLWTGIVGLLFSWGRGLVLYSPVGLLGMILLFFSKRLDSWTKWVIGFLFFFFLIIHAKWSYWYGGWCWGPRLLLPVLAFSGLGLIHLFEKETHRRIWATLLFGVGGLINFLAIFVPFSIYYQSALAHGVQEDWLLWRVHYCPLKIQHEMLSQFRVSDYDYVWLGADRWGWPVWVMGALGLVLMIHGFWRIHRLVWRPSFRGDIRSLVPANPVE